jgi:natural product precursor
MEKIKFEGKLNLKKETIAKLSDEQMGELKGGGFMSIGKHCTQPGHCPSKVWSKGLFCEDPS